MRPGIKYVYGPSSRTLIHADCSFKPGYAICIAFACLSALACTTYYLACVWQNRSRDRKRESTAHLSEREKTELGDMSPEYRYQL